MASKRHYNICPDCGAYLDPGERCDCYIPTPHIPVTRERIQNMQAAEARNTARITEYQQHTISCQKER